MIYQIIIIIIIFIVIITKSCIYNKIDEAKLSSHEN